jgi:two-component system phosphate regulon response regulator PhoB
MPKTVLIAEDDADVRLMLYTLFKDQGFTVFTAKDGRDALRIMREEGIPDVLFVDYNMPGATGVEVIREARKRQDKPITAIVATATHMRTSDDVTKTLSQADLMLAKPFNYDHLVGLIKKIAERPS